MADRAGPGSRRAAVLGRPVGHSLSPLLHRAAHAALGLTDWTYDALDVGADELPVLLAGLGEEWRGFSVTMPCKQAAVDAADVVEPLPRLLHAANTLVRTDAGWRAENTDVAGIGTALRAAGVTEVGRAAIVGAGGTAAAAAVALASFGAEHVDVVVREPARGADLLRVLATLAVPTTAVSLAGAVVDADVVVSTVPVGGQDAVAALPWHAEQTVLDVLYDPWPTPLATRVAAVGGTVVGGLEVLFWQATVQVELMTGQPAPIAAMRAALDTVLDAR
ncbi:shikimate dehydrogenase [Geodermatophilus sp. TF02-6]|uniref:shikimate dehydrogenase n=1 Tax=Geodermatophilus sp. TF02-6 TaxID=2250575 RepID=UPI000DE9C105|nr:shikimate dehydrogenase [Geodermatophilus sp. TF02-6]RBY76733.1 shikimate dehydrogenase [Geodermatophilus sp. TF02-6]